VCVCACVGVCMSQEFNELSEYISRMGREPIRHRLRVDVSTSKIAMAIFELSPSLKRAKETLALKTRQESRKGIRESLSVTLLPDSLCS